MAALGVLAVAPAAQARDLAVTTTSDDNSPGSLRMVLAEARTGDSVVVPPGVYALARDRGPLVVQRDGIRVRGAGARATAIDGGDATSVLAVRAPGTLTLEALTLRAGRAEDDGGLAHVAEGSSLTVIDAALRDGQAGNGTLAGRGGAAYNAGTLVLVRSLAAGNVAAAGAVAFGQGGAIYSSGTLTATNTTFSGNLAGGNVASARGGAVLTGVGGRSAFAHATFAGNGAGTTGSGGHLAVDDGGDATIRASVLGPATGRPGAEACDGSITSQGHNLQAGSDCAFGAEGDRDDVDARLGPLADAGGGTDVHDLPEGSPAVDSVPVAGCPDSDQRGAPRPSGPRCDAGAVERAAAPPPPPGPSKPAPLPPPVLGATVNLEFGHGTVTVRLPGGRGRTLTGSRQVPVGTRVDATGGLVRLTGTTDSAGTSATAKFFDGAFEVHQDAGSGSATPVDLKLRVTKAPTCGTAKSLQARKRGKRRAKGRGLWGRGKGRFRTRGRHSAATVRGTWWYVGETCKGTFTRVRAGAVDVRDLPRRRTIRLGSGDSYTARARGCVSRRVVTLTLPGGRDHRSAEVTVAGHRGRATVRGRRARVDLRGLREGTYTVRIKVTRPDGRVLRDTRRYRTCVS